MLKRNITYEDYEGNACTDTYYFNLTKTELVKLLSEFEGGIEKEIKRIIEKGDNKQLIVIFDKIVLGALGTKADDGKRFIKNQDIIERFTQSMAYDALFMELSQNEKAFLEFVQGVFPADVSNEIVSALNEQTKEVKS